MTTKTELQRRVFLKVMPQEAYKLLSTKEKMEQWYCDRVETRDKGFEFVWNMQDGGTAGFSVDIVEAMPGKRFAYRSVGEYPTTTGFDLSPADGGTQIVMTETFHPDTPDLEALYNEHSGGWDWFFSRLSELG